MTDSRIGKRIEIQPCYDLWMRGDKYGTIVAISRKTYNYIDPQDWRNGKRFTVRMDLSGKRIRISENGVQQFVD